MKKILIDEAIFNRYPDFCRGVILISDINNAVLNDQIQELLDNEIKKRAGQNLIEHDYVKAWDKIHKAFGSNPNKFPPSIKSLLKRIEKGEHLPFINSVVALFNYISIKYLVPCGGDDIEKIEGNLKLGFSKGNEIFIPLGKEEKEKPEVGEVIYFDDKTLNVMCRRWNWRNGDFTKINPTSKKIVVNLDGISPVPRNYLKEARDELAQLLEKYCSAKLTTDFLNKDRKEIEIKEG